MTVTNTGSSIVRYGGVLWRVRKSPTEAEEQAKDRAWYMAKNLPAKMPILEKESLARAWANEKHMGIRLAPPPHASPHASHADQADPPPLSLSASE